MKSTYKLFITKKNLPYTKYLEYQECILLFSFSLILFLEPSDLQAKPVIKNKICCKKNSK